MLALFLILGVAVALFALHKVGPERAVLAVFLPVMMLWPYGTGYRFKGVELDIMTMVALPIAAALVWKHAHRWRYSVVDLLVLTYCFSTLLSNWNADGQSAGLALGTSQAFGCLPPYIVGRLAIERPGLRLAFARRFAFLAFVVSLISVYEYRMERNFFRIWSDRLFNNQSHLGLQLRWGYARIAGPYGHAIIADCILLCALLLAIWIAGQDGWGRKFKRLRFVPGHKAVFIILGLMLGVWMTQSRGPWLGGAFGALLVLAARAKKQKRAFALVAVSSIALMAVFYSVVNQYTSINQTASNQDQENAQYRRYLIINYTPVVERGGMLGYGLHFPKIDGQVSIDNEYLNIALNNGYLGLGSFVGLILVTGTSLVRKILGSRDREETGFALCLLGLFATIALSITTVYLGFQAFTLFFLIVGWAQELRPAPAPAVAAEPAVSYPPVRFAFRRVWS